MRLIDADAFDKCLEGAEIEATKSQKYVFSSAINTIRGNLANFPTVNHWIPCSERLPEDDVYVLISKKPSQISGNKFSVTIGMRYINRRSKKAEWRDSGFGYLSDDKVLAWMPLPSPYQEEGEEE